MIQKASKLARFSKQIISCRVVIELPHRHHQQGNRYNVRISVSVPGREIVTTHDSTESKNHQDLRLALVEAFESTERQLNDYIELKRGA